MAVSEAEQSYDSDEQHESSFLCFLTGVWATTVSRVRGIDLTACYGHCCDASLPRGTAGGSMPDLRPYECDADD